MDSWERLGGRERSDRTSAAALRFVLTGASGGGKTAIIEALERSGFTCAAEAGRAIVREQMQGGGDGLPWRNRERFRDLLFARSVAIFEAMAKLDGPVFFDRGIVEALAYSRYIGVAVPAEWQTTVRRLRYARIVFVVPPWKAIFLRDAERRKSWADVLADYLCTVEAYEAAGYHLVEVPRAPLAARVRFILLRASLGEEASGAR